MLVMFHMFNRNQKIVWSVVDPSQRNPHKCSPVILFSCEVNLDRRMVDEILNVNNKEW